MKNTTENLRWTLEPVAEGQWAPLGLNERREEATEGATSRLVLKPV